MGRQKKTQENEKEGSCNFTWTDDEVELLLSVINHFKSEKEAEGYDWESVKTKYESIREQFLQSYPKESNDKFPKKDLENEFTKARIISKIKGIRVKYRRAVDSGRKSGGGRVVATFYDACESIWGGCPAVETINGGIESSLPATDDPQNIEEADGDKDDHSLGLDEDDQADEQSSIELSNPNKRRSLVDHLKEQRNSKLKKKIPAEKQMLDVAKEDVSVKKDLLTQMKSTDKDQSDQLRALNETMVNLTKSINEGMVNIETALYRASQLNAVPLPNHQFLPTQSPYGQNNGSLNPVQRQLNTYNFFSPNDGMMHD